MVRRLVRFGLAACLLLTAGCRDATGPEGWGSGPGAAVDYRDEMRGFVQVITAYARAQRPDFVVATRNGLPLLTENGRPDGSFISGFVDAVSGVVQDGVHYNLDEDGSPTDPVPDDELSGYLDRLVDAGTPVLATSYCLTPDEIDDAYSRSSARSYLAFAAPGTDCDVIPDYPAAPPGLHAGDVDSLPDAHNYLQMLSAGSSSGRGEYLAQLAATDYDVLVVDAFYGGVLLTASELEELRTKCNGGRRLVVALLSVGAAEVYRDYWRTDWETDPPSWLEPADPDHPEFRFVRYWDSGWIDVIVGRPDAYLDRVIAAGFDGILLDRVDAYEYFEDCYG